MHSVYLDDEYVAVKESSKKTPYEEEVYVENNIAPEGYLTSKEFRKRAVEIVNTFCDRHGIL